MTRQRDTVVLLPIPEKCANREVALKYIKMIEKKMMRNDIDEMIGNALLEDRVQELERENAELRARIAELSAANVKLGHDCDIYREGLAQMCNEMETEFNEILEKSVQELKMKLWNKARSTLHRQGKAPLYAQMRQEFEDVFSATGARLSHLQRQFALRGYASDDIKAVAHMQFNARGNQDRLVLGERLVNLTRELSTR